MVNIAIFISGVILSISLVYIVKKNAVSLGFIDVPNDRSSHSAATPRGGGLAFLLIGQLYFAYVLFKVEKSEAMFSEAILIGGSIVGLVAFLDDKWNLNALVRLFSHLLAVLVLLLWLTPYPIINPGSVGFSFEVVLYAISIVSLIWLINLYNFMDGVDGIAASEAAFVIFSVILLLYLSDSELNFLNGFLWLMLGSCLGFLFFNKSPASIFMGDVGSCYLGFIIGAIAVYTQMVGSISFFAWLIIPALFIVDATMTLLWRIYRGEHWSQAHRSHCYQVLSRKLNSHNSVVIILLSINLCWLLPLALLAEFKDDYAMACVLIAYFPLIIGQIRFGLSAGLKY